MDHSTQEAAPEPARTPGRTTRELRLRTAILVCALGITATVLADQAGVFGAQLSATGTPPGDQLCTPVGAGGTTIIAQKTLINVGTRDAQIVEVLPGQASNLEVVAWGIGAMPLDGPADPEVFGGALTPESGASLSPNTVIKAGEQGLVQTELRLPEGAERGTTNKIVVKYTTSGSPRVKTAYTYERDSLVPQGSTSCLSDDASAEDE
ncbi:hypothetical protein GCM10027417_27120 [Glutamicibacter endophyticus]